ncbi:MAG: sugar ABC transporter permease [Acidimicrobiales bacterium]|nr:sugar ABC transporter permease [Acidimicrobiales bacterium]
MSDSTAVASSAPAASNGWMSRRGYTWRETGLAFGFLAPSLIVFVAFFYAPFFKLLNWGRFKAVKGGQSYTDAGLQQYRDVLTGKDFTDGLWHSVQFVLWTVPFGLLFGTLLAVAAHRRLRGIKVFQAIFSSTLASSVAVSSVIFFFLLNPVVGAIKGWDPIASPRWSIFAAALPSIWQNLGLAFVIVLAGLQAIPDEVIEASMLDGYSPFRRLIKITLPLISPVLLFLFVILVIFGFQAFAQIEIITRGGPAGSSETLVFKIFQETQNYGKGAVMSVGLFLITLVVTFLQFAILERRVHYGDS